MASQRGMFFDIDLYNINEFEILKQLCHSKNSKVKIFMSDLIAGYSLSAIYNPENAMDFDDVGRAYKDVLARAKVDPILAAELKKISGVNEAKVPSPAKAEIDPKKEIKSKATLLLDKLSTMQNIISQPFYSECLNSVAEIKKTGSASAKEIKILESLKHRITQGRTTVMLSDLIKALNITPSFSETDTSHFFMHKTMGPTPLTPAPEVKKTPLDLVTEIYKDRKNLRNKTRAEINAMQGILAYNARLDVEATRLILTSRLHLLLMPDQIVDLYVVHQKNPIFVKLSSEVLSSAALPVLLPKMRAFKFNEVLFLALHPELAAINQHQRRQYFPDYDDDKVVRSSSPDYGNDQVVRSCMPDESQASNFRQLRDAKIDPYDFLGITRAATDAEIRQAFKAKSLQYHPDKVDRQPGYDPARHEILRKEAEDAFKLLPICRDILLISPEAKKFMDGYLDYMQSQPRPRMR